MKKNIVFIFLFLIFPLSVYADSMELKCTDNDEKNVVCDIYGDSNDTITEISFEITMTGNISISKININDSWRIIDNQKTNLTIAGKNSTPNFKIGDITFNNDNGEKGYVGIESIKFKTAEAKELTINNIKRHVPTNSNDSLLKNIILDRYLINFSPNIYEYSLKIHDEDKLNITAVPELQNTKYQIHNNQDLVNDSVIEIITTSETNMSTTYTIKIIKDEKPDTQYYLYIFAGIVFFIVLINIIRIISSKKNN